MYPKILVCDKSGMPHHWATWEDGIVLKYKNLLSYEMGDISVYSGGMSRMTGERSKVEVAPIVFLREILKYESRIPPLTNQNLFIRDRHTCIYCGRHYTESKLSRDHIIPVSKGGKNIWTNVGTCCKTCNHTKDDDLLEDLDMKLLFVPYQPNHSERLVMQNKNILADQMDFLAAFLPTHSRVLS